MFRKTVLWTIIAVAMVLIPCSHAHANTDGSEVQVTAQTDRLVIQLSPEWAGVEFELKTDAGIYPAPVIVDYTGILTMDLGGSTSYILSCLNSPVSVPAPSQTAGSTAEISEGEAQPDESSQSSQGHSEQSQPGIPTGHLVFFLIGLVAAVDGLVVMRLRKNRSDEDDYDEDE